ncbi:catalase family protein [Paracoccus shanxieyensis]|uniref:Catalase n=1 Tax=Paracoccus shanxieyensis TaxID=2675752 RepID=A0A6L6IXC6_9RHOB|nr:catalase family protein [Paracoccus shanxieyensis]MTH64873.1 catalase [Paracoccus shanxieyensis]MTH87894.1 catalase [Paracoccus shanxieyensis]
MQPVRYSEAIETTQPDEDKLTREIVARMAAKQAADAERHRHAHRDAHAKSHAVIKGRLTILADLPPELAQGIFAQPRTHEIVSRISSAASDIHSDAIPQPHGFATKIIGVQGERLTPELGGSNQDVLMVNFPTLAFGTIAKYDQLLGLLESKSAAPDVVQQLAAAAARGVKGAVEALGGRANATLDGLARDQGHPLGETFHTQAALRYGDYLAKLSIAPTGEVAELTGQQVKGGYSAMRDAITDWFSTRGATYELRAQLCTDPKAMPVEDAAILWDPEISPHRVIATLHFDPQDSYSPPRQVQGDDHLAFNPWNGVAAHRPLGGIMRIRKAAYESSSALRHRLNALERREPDSLAEIAD